MSTDDFFRARLQTVSGMRHPLAVLARRMPWKEIEAALAPVLAHKDRAGRGIEGADLFGPTLAVAVAVAGAGMSHAGRPRLPIRLMVSLLYLKHAYNESDESVVERWSENVYWVRRETGEEQVVQVHCNEGVAIRIGPEPCGHDREGMAEASAGVRAGQPLSHDIVLVPGADTLQYVEGNIPQRAIASDAGARRGRRTWHARTFLAREPGDLQSDRRRPYGLAARIGKARSRSR